MGMVSGISIQPMLVCHETMRALWCSKMCESDYVTHAGLSASVPSYRATLAPATLAPAMTQSSSGKYVVVKCCLLMYEELVFVLARLRNASSLQEELQHL